MGDVWPDDIDPQDKTPTLSDVNLWCEKRYQAGYRKGREDAAKAIEDWAQNYDPDGWPTLNIFVAKAASIARRENP